MHIKRLSSPKSWPIARKGISYIIRPLPGGQQQHMSIALGVVLRDFLHLCRTTSEAKKAVHDKKVLINHIEVTDYRRPLGIFDILTIKGPEPKHYTLLFTKNGKLSLHPLSPSHASSQLLKIIRKLPLQKNKLQITFHNGHTAIVDASTPYHVGDSVIVKDKKILKHLASEKGCLLYLVGGRYVGRSGILEEIKTFPGGEDDRVVIKGGKTRIETLRSYSFVVEKDFIGAVHHEE